MNPPHPLSVMADGKITVPTDARLVFNDTGPGGDAIALQTLGLVIDGVVEAGSPTCRLDGVIVMTLHGEFDSSATPTTTDRGLFESAKADMHVKAIAVTGAAGSRLDLHGKLYHPTWTRLAAHVPGHTQAETAAPGARNSELFLFDCVNWPDGGTIVVTTSHAKDTRGYHFNEEATIAAGGTECIEVGGERFGKVTLTAPLEHYHHAGEHEYQCEVALLTRSIKVQGNPTSEPTDTTPLICDASEETDLVGITGYTEMPCTMTSTSFWTVSRAFCSSTSPHTRCGPCSTW